MTKQELIQAFLNAVNTWKLYVTANKAANKNNRNEVKSMLTKAVFYWRLQAEKFKKMIDFAMFAR